MESAPPSSFRSVQLPVKSRSSNFLLALRPQRPARCWAFFNRAERSPPSLLLSPSQSLDALQPGISLSQAVTRTNEGANEVCLLLRPTPAHVRPPLYLRFLPPLLSFLPANVFLAPNKTKPISESVMSGLWEERRMSGIIRQTSRHMGWDHMCSDTRTCKALSASLPTFEIEAQPEF